MNVTTVARTDIDSAAAWIRSKAVGRRQARDMFAETVGRYSPEALSSAAAAQAYEKIAEQVAAIGDLSAAEVPADEVARKADYLYAKADYYTDAAREYGTEETTMTLKAVAWAYLRCASEVSYLYC